MKKLSLIFIMAIAAFSSYAQSSFKEDVDVLNEWRKSPEGWSSQIESK